MSDEENTTNETLTIRTLGFNLQVLNVPKGDTWEDQFNALVPGTPDAARAYSINAAINGSVGPDARDHVCAQIEAITGVERLSEDTEKVDEEENPIYKYTETQGQYVKRALETSGKTADELQDAIGATQFEFSVAEKREASTTAKVGKIGKRALEQAQNYIDAEKAEGVAEKLMELNDGLVVDAESAESLARGLKINKLRIDKETDALLAGLVS